MSLQRKGSLMKFAMQLVVCFWASLSAVQSLAWALPAGNLQLVWSELIPGGAAGGNLAAIEINRGIIGSTLTDPIVDTASAGLKYVSNMAFDSISGLLYWTDRNAGRIQRSTLRGTGLETVVATTHFGQPASLLGLAIDAPNSMMYWSDGFDRTILKQDLTGGAATVIATGLYAGDLAVDAKASLIFFSNPLLNMPEGPYDRIDVATVDGAGRHTVISGIVQLTAVSVDALAKKLYWADVRYNSSDDTVIRRSNYDGSNIETIASGLPDVILDLKVDSARGLLFWTSRDEGAIKQSDLNGGNQITLLSGLSYPHALLMIPEPRGALLAIVATIPSLVIRRRGSGKLVRSGDVLSHFNNLFRTAFGRAGPPPSIPRGTVMADSI